MLRKLRALLLPAGVHLVVVWAMRPESASGQVHSKVINGKRAAIDQFPWQAAICGRFESTSYCGGTVISPRFIVTAAHCVERVSSHDIYVKTGIVDLHDSNGTISSVKRIIIHPKYRKPYNDIALLELSKSLALSALGARSHVNMVALPRSDVHVSGDCIVSGWGYTEVSEASRYLLYAWVPHFDHQACRDAFQEAVRITEEMLCYGGGDTDSCQVRSAEKRVRNEGYAFHPGKQGDSGGPLICTTNNGTSFLAGCVSFGMKQCATSDIPGVYTNVAKYQTWIESLTRAVYKVPDLGDGRNGTIRFPVIISSGNDHQNNTTDSR